MTEEVNSVNEAADLKWYGIIPAASLAMLFVVSITVLAFSVYRPPSGEAESQTAAVAKTSDAFLGLSLIAKSVIVVDIKNNKVLYARNPDVQLPLASLAKVAMALAVSEALPPDAVIEIPRDTAGSRSAERLAKGEKWRVRDVIDFTLLSSSNEGAEILADAADDAMREKYPDASEYHATVWRMNTLAQELGLNRTYFLNASGLDISPTLSGSYGSARDMAVLFSNAALNRISIFGRTADDAVIFTSSDNRRTLRAFNTNEARAEIPGLLMGKTGITDLAGGNLAVVFDAVPARPVVAVVLGSTRDGRFTDMLQLVAKTREVIPRGNLISTAN